MTKQATSATVKPVDRNLKNQGMNWIKQHKRLAIYLRDGLACAYCGLTLEEGAKLTLDHLKPYSEGGSNLEGNLVTCCSRCNSSRQTRTVAEFAEAAANYVGHGIKGSEIVAHIEECITRKLDIKAAKALVDLRGSCFKVLQQDYNSPLTN